MTYERLMNMPRIAAALVALSVLSCAKEPPVRPEPEPTQPAARPSDLDRRLLEIAGEYQHYGIVDTKFSWVQTLCRIYQPPARFSESDDKATHGGKIYLLYAKDWKAYVAGIKDAQPAGQAIVKEAWEPKAISREDSERFHSYDREHRMQPAERDGQHFTAGEKHGLFIMFKDPAGWQFGTVSPDGKRVIRSGCISSCLKCHQEAKPDSLYGLPGHPQDR